LTALFFSDIITPSSRQTGHTNNMYSYFITYRSIHSDLTISADFIANSLAEVEEMGKDWLMSEGIDDFYPVDISISIND
jgi:hypothetical protein